MLALVVVVGVMVSAGAGAAFAMHSTATAGTEPAYTVPVVVGAVPYWDEPDARTSIQTQGSALTVASPWIYAAAADGSVQPQPGVDATAERSQAAWLHGLGLKVVPTVADTTQGRWDPATVSALIADPALVAGAADAGGKIEIVDQNGERHTARLVGRSPVYDLAVLYVPDAKDLTPAALGRSESLRIGEGVVAIGSPLGLSSTVTSGIVSALDRPVTTGGQEADDLSYINAVQTDAAINPGNSGGPLVNLRGQVVGVNSAIATAGGGFGGEAGNIGVGFAIPVEQVRVTADQILKDGEARYPVIGAQVNTGRADQEGAPVVEVMGGTPAEEAGLREGDLITAVDGERVTDGIALIVSIRTHQPGETIEFTVERDGREQTVPITLDSEVG